MKWRYTDERKKIFFASVDGAKLWSRLTWWRTWVSIVSFHVISNHFRLTSFFIILSSSVLDDISLSWKIDSFGAATCWLDILFWKQLYFLLQRIYFKVTTASHYLALINRVYQSTKIIQNKFYDKAGFNGCFLCLCSLFYCPKNSN